MTLYCMTNSWAALTLPRLTLDDNSRLLRSLCSRRMVMNNHPLPINLAKDEREVAADRRLIARQSPAAEDQGGGVIQRRHFKLRESKLAHLLPRGIPSLVILLRAFPAARRLAAGAERQLV